MMETTKALEAVSLVHRYGETEALSGISFSIEKGEVAAILGPNGAGKTTTLRILTGCLWPTSGEVRISEARLDPGSAAARRRIGYLPEAAPLHSEMRVGDFLEYMGILKGLTRLEARTRAGRSAESTGIGGKLGERIGTLSKGYRQRTAMAAAILNEPEFLVLDEPTSALDPNQVIEMRNLIRDLGRTRTVILSTHILQEVEAVASRVILLSKGRIIADGSVEDISRMASGGIWIAAVHAGEKDAVAAVEGAEGVSSAKARERRDGGGPGGATLVEAVGEGDLGRSIFRALAAAGIDASEIRPERARLEDAFARLTGGGKDD